jgi:HSP20 family molecular chaperone IbpA
MKGESMVRLEQSLEPASRALLQFLREVRHATIEELREVIGESCHMNVLIRIEQDLNRKAEGILGGPLLVFEFSRADPETQETVACSWWLSREVEGLLSPREAMVDIFVEKESIVVVAQLPGVREEDIRVTVKPELLLLFVDTPGHNHYQEIPIPAPVRTDRIQTRYHNQVLRIELEREDADTPS